MGKKSLICPLEGYDDEIKRALEETECFGELMKLEKEQISKLRRVAEELLGMVEGIFNVASGRFFIEEDNGDYVLTLKAKTIVGQRAKAILNTISKNDRYKGFQGVLRHVFDTIYEAIGNESPAADVAAIDDALAGACIITNDALEISVSKYADMVERDEKADNWDELELSVIKSLSKDIKIYYSQEKVVINVIANI